MFLIVWIITIFLSLLFNDRRKIGILTLIPTFLSFAVIFIGLGRINGLYDIEIAIDRYENFEYFTSFTEIGYSTIINLGHYLNFSYREFFIFIALIEIFLIFWYFLKNSAKPNITIAFFMFFPAIVVSQYSRNLIGFCIFLLGFNSLLHKTNLYIIKFILCTIVGSLFHYSILFFLILLLIRFKYFKQLVLIVFFLSLLLLVPYIYNVFIYLISFIFGESRAQMLVAQRDEGNGLVGTVSLCIVPFVFYLIFSSFIKHCHKNYQENMTDLFFNNLNFSSILLVPLTLFFSQPSSRLIFFYIILFLPYLVNKTVNLKIFTHKINSFCIILLGLTMESVLLYRNADYVEQVLYPFFFENDLVKSSSNINGLLYALYYYL